MKPKFSSSCLAVSVRPLPSSTYSAWRDSASSTRSPGSISASACERCADRDRLADADRRRARTSGACAVSQHAVVRRVEEAQQRGLADAVGPEQSHAVAGAEPPGLPVQHLGHAGRRGERDVLEVVDLLAEPRGRELLQREPVARRRLVRDELVGRVDAELGLARARGRTAAQPGELLAQQVLAPLLARLRLARALGLREHVRRVAAVVALHARVDDLPRLGRDRVEEPAVVGDGDERAAAYGEVLGEPRDRLDVEVVGGLVEHEQVGVVDHAGAASAARRRSPPDIVPTTVSSPSVYAAASTPPSRPSITSRMRASPAHSWSARSPTTTVRSVDAGVEVVGLRQERPP